MSRLDPEKLSVEFKEGVSSTDPIIPRRYTLTHSDITAELYLSIGLQYDYDKVEEMRDEVLGEWIQEGENYRYHVYLNVNGAFKPGTANIRASIFRRELPLALQAIRFGDQLFFGKHPDLDYVPIIVYFNSSLPQLNTVEEWGTFSEYDIYRTGAVYSDLDLYEGSILIDSKVGDVSGDGIPDSVMLYGNKSDLSEIYMQNIVIVIEDGGTKEIRAILPEQNAGYNPTLFLGDFTGDGVKEIKVSIDSGGSGGYGYHYVYSFIGNQYREIFNFDSYNMEYQFRVDYLDQYKVSIGNEQYDKLFLLDISDKDEEYISQLYHEDGTLITPVQGEVLALSALIPFVMDEKDNIYGLTAYQRIIGVTNSDTLGYIENTLTWNGEQFVSAIMFVSIPSSDIISMSSDS